MVFIFLTHHNNFLWLTDDLKISILLAYLSLVFLKWWQHAFLLLYLHNTRKKDVIIQLLQLLPGPLWFGVVAPDRALSMGQIELTAYLCKTELFDMELFLCQTELFQLELF